MRRLLAVGMVAIALTVMVLWGGGLLQVGRESTVEAPGDAGTPAGGAAAVEEDPALYDGPYVFWSGDALAYVGSICGDTALFETVEGEPGALLRFTDPCAPERSYEINPTPSQPDPAVFAGGGRIFAVSDVEGNADELLVLLRDVGVIDENDRWAWGDGRLVFVGDMVDRGDQVTEELWFVHQLERQALQAGGRVHVVLGNHDAMLLYNDHRYVADKYRAVAPKFRATLSSLYGPDTELGRWLRTKPTMLRIGDILFVHGGISTVLADAGLDLDGVNETVRLALDEPWRSRAPGVHQMLLGSDGPMWYRGYFRDDVLPADEIARTLDVFGANTVVVGHTIVEEVQQLHDGLVYGVNVTFTDADALQGLLIEDGNYYRVDAAGGAPVLIGSRQR